ncbi:MAG: ATP-binding protein [Deltaproteobacteria bacterium]|nr:ATP-binding protein [Deltaproteobacteria bacterium]MBW2417849.1 ATP-binding protein [Deltaproteobacteria bacterium]
MGHPLCHLSPGTVSPGRHTSSPGDKCNRSTILTSQLPAKSWHDHVGDPTIADASCDRLLHTAHQIDLKVKTLMSSRAVVMCRGDMCIYLFKSSDM